MVVFLGSAEGRSKKGNDYKRVSLLEIRRKSSDGTLVGRAVDFFVDKDVDVSKLVAGDVVNASFEESELLGGTPELVKVERIGENIFEALV